MSTVASGSSCIDGIATAVLGFALGVCVNSAEPPLRWLLWIIAGQ